MGAGPLHHKFWHQNIESGTYHNLGCDGAAGDWSCLGVGQRMLKDSSAGLCTSGALTASPHEPQSQSLLLSRSFFFTTFSVFCCPVRFDATTVPCLAAEDNMLNMKGCGDPTTSQTHL